MRIEGTLMKKSPDTSTQFALYLVPSATSRLRVRTFFSPMLQRGTRLLGGRGSCRAAQVIVRQSTCAARREPRPQPTSTFVTNNAAPRGMSCEKNGTPPKTLPWTDKFCQIVRKLAAVPRTWSTGYPHIFPQSKLNDRRLVQCPQAQGAGTLPSQGPSALELSASLDFQRPERPDISGGC
ncbi:MAG: hypothetical protein JWP89_1416 [Schlesneria sp.]|nr:hypothetical protein [Schlesneria sp.]